MFPTLKLNVAQLFLTGLSQLVTFHLILKKKRLRQACLEKGQLKEDQISFAREEIFAARKLMAMKQMIHRVIRMVASAKKYNLGQKNAGKRGGASFLKLPA